MKVSLAIVVAAFVLGAAAQNAAPATTTPPAVADVPKSETDKCLDKCPATDNVCRSICTKVPNPTEEQTIKTNECVGKCDKTDAEKYKVCQQNCINTIFVPITKPTANGNNNNNNGGNSNNNPSGNTGNNNGGSNSAASALTPVLSTLGAVAALAASVLAL